MSAAKFGGLCPLPGPSWDHAPLRCCLPVSTQRSVGHTYTIRYDTIRDVILTCARKPTWVGSIYRTETTTKNCKTEKLKSKNRYVRSNSKSLGNHVVSSEEKMKGCSGKDLQKKKVLSFFTWVEGIWFSWMECSLRGLNDSVHLPRWPAPPDNNQQQQQFGTIFPPTTENF